MLSLILLVITSSIFSSQLATKSISIAQGAKAQESGDEDGKDPNLNSGEDGEDPNSNSGEDGNGNSNEEDNQIRECDSNEYLDENGNCTSKEEPDPRGNCNLDKHSDNQEGVCAPEPVPAIVGPPINPLLPPTGSSGPLVIPGPGICPSGQSRNPIDGFCVDAPDPRSPDSVPSGPEGCIEGYYKDPIEPVCHREKFEIAGPSIDLLLPPPDPPIFRGFASDPTLPGGASPPPLPPPTTNPNGGSAAPPPLPPPPTTNPNDDHAPTGSATFPDSSKEFLQTADECITEFPSVKSVSHKEGASLMIKRIMPETEQLIPGGQFRITPNPYTLSGYLDVDEDRKSVV